MRVSPYLFMDGKCEEAFTFYADLLGAKIDAMMRYEGSPAAEHVGKDWHGKIMHACMSIGDQMLMASDAPPGNTKAPQGFSVSIHVDEPAEAERVFAGLADGGTVTMPMEQTFWARRFGMVTDRFGTPWMVNCADAEAGS